VPATEASHFLARLQSPRRMLLHLAEGIGTRARSHFLDLRLADGRWALAPNLIGIHAAGLVAEDFAVLAEHGVGIVWSPLSNLLLYGATADVGAARAAGVAIALGGDWSPSGSKNLLGELKAARVAAPASVPDDDLVAMATCTPARLLGWQGELGSLRPGSRADLLVVDERQGQTGGPYRPLLEAHESGLGLVMIDGVARFGRPGLLAALAVPDPEPVRVGGRQRVINLVDAAEDPLVAGLSLAKASEALHDAMQHLPELAAEDERRPKLRDDDGWRLDLDHQVPEETFAPPAGLVGGFVPAQLAAPLSTLLEPMRPDRLTAADDASFLATLAAEQNLPEALRRELLALYR
jgi:5-methylthioadenosine/S-adenosylhomocysteine deaminase